MKIIVLGKNLHSVGCGHTSQQVLQRSLVNKQQSIFCRQYFVGYRTIVKEEVSLEKKFLFLYHTILNRNNFQVCSYIFVIQSKLVLLFHFEFECLSKLILHRQIRWRKVLAITLDCCSLNFVQKQKFVKPHFYFLLGLNRTSRPVPVVQEFSNVRILDFRFFSFPDSRHLTLLKFKKSPRFVM